MKMVAIEIIVTEELLDRLTKAADKARVGVEHFISLQLALMMLDSE